MTPPIYYNSVFPYLHLTLDDIDVNDIECIPQWIDQLLQETPQTFHQINLDASHPLIYEIVFHLKECIPTDSRLSYIRVKQSRTSNYLTRPLLNELMSSVKANDNHQNITVQVITKRKVAYY